MRRRRTYPGSIYKPANADRLYIKYKGRRLATGLRATKEGYRIAELMLEKMYLQTNDLATHSSTLTVYEALSRYIAEHPKYLEKTIKTYKYAVSTVFSASDLLNKLTIVNAVSRYVNTSKHSKTTSNIILRHIQALCNYFTSQGILEAIALKGYKQSVRNTSKSFTNLEVYRLVKYFACTNREMALLVLFMYGTGARSVDAFGLTLDRIKKDEIIWLNKKTKEPEPRPYSKNIACLIKKQMIMNANDTHLFRWHYPNTSYPSKLFRLACDHLGIERNGRSLQELRVSFRMRLLSAGVPKEIAQYYLRHSESSLIDKHYTVESGLKLVDFLEGL